MPRRRQPKHTAAREALVERLIAAILAAEIRHSSLWDDDHTREDEETNLRFRLRHADDVLATWTTATHDEVCLRLRVDGERLGRFDIEMTAGPRDEAWTVGDVLDLEVVWDAHADLTELVRRIASREARVDAALPVEPEGPPSRFVRADPFGDPP